MMKLDLFLLFFLVLVLVAAAGCVCVCLLLLLCQGLLHIVDLCVSKQYVKLKSISPKCI